MGSWGYGMLENDTALDAKDEFNKLINNVVESLNTPLELFKKVRRSYSEDPLAVLGIAQVLFDNGIDLRPLKKIILPYITSELNSKEIDSWDRPKSRAKALLRFRKCLVEKPPPRKKKRIHKYTIGTKLKHFKYNPSEHGSFSEGLLPITININDMYKTGFVDREGNIAIEPIYDNALNFCKGLAAVEINNKWGYIDKTGIFIIKPSFNDAKSFSKGKARVHIGDEYNGKYVYIDRKGKIVLDLKFSEIQEYDKGLALARVNDRWGYINKNEEFVIKPKYTYAENFNRDFAKVRQGWGAKVRYGFIDKKGKVVIKLKYQELGNFCEGLAVVRLKGKYGYINKKGDLVIPLRFDESLDFINGIAGIRLRSKWGFINKTGKMIVNPKYEDAKVLYLGHVIVKMAGKWWHIDKKGNCVSKCD